MAEIVGQNMVRKSPETLKTRERLSDEEMGNLLSSVGNHEAKAITLLVIGKGGVFDMSDLRTEALNVQGEIKGWRMDKNTPFDYCSESFSPIGLVVREALDFDLSTFGYSITDKGKELGIPLAGLLLDFSERHSIPLNRLFGSTHSPHSKSKIVQGKEGEEIEFRKRAPSTTLKILYAILASSTFPIREVDIEKGVEDTPKGESLLNPHLIRLSKLDLIQHNAIEINKAFSSYKLADILPEAELPMYKWMPTLTKSIFNVLKSHPNEYLTINDVLGLLPRELKERRSQKNLNTRISRILSFLAENKYADRRRFHHHKQSEISITNEQREVLKELIEIIHGFQNQDEEILEKGRRLAGQIISNPQRVSALLKRVKEASPYVNKFPQEETRDMILSIVLANSNGITSKEIQISLEEQYDRELSAQRIFQLLASLVKNMSVKIDKHGASNVYYPKDKAES